MAEKTQRRNQTDDRPIHSAEDVRGAEIILRTRTRKIIFFGGLVGFIILILVLNIVRIATS
jgi:hypothetical protein